MAFSASNLSQLALGNNLKLCIFSSASDNIVAINSAGYFNGAADMLGVHDLMIVCVTATTTTNFCTVLSKTGSVVDVSDGTAVAETDSDQRHEGGLRVAPVPIQPNLRRYGQNATITLADSRDENVLAFSIRDCISDDAEVVSKTSPK